MKVAYSTAPFSMRRRMAAASAEAGRKHSTIHGITEVDITAPRRLLREHRERTGESLSLTAFVVASLARAVAEHPRLNAFRRGRKLILLEDVTISVLVEREVEGERIPEPFGIRAAQKKTYRQIHEEIRAAQRHVADHLGSLSGMGWVRFIPGLLLRAFIHFASRSIAMMGRYGVVGVTAVGMFGNDALWFIPLSSATVNVTVGGIIKRPVCMDDQVASREQLCLTVSFDHAIVDGAPAARFLRRLAELLSSGAALREGELTA